MSYSIQIEIQDSRRNSVAEKISLTLRCMSQRGVEKNAESDSAQFPIHQWLGMAFTINA